MRRTLIIAGRELRAFFLSPIAYVIGFLFVFFRGWEAVNLSYVFSIYGQDFNMFPMNYTVGLCGQIMLVLAPPLLTMRLFAEEKRTGSLELLMTAPVKDHEIVMGKWIASLVFYFLLWLPTIVLLLLLQAPWLLGINMPLGPIFTAHLWVFLVGPMFLSIGIFCSSLTQNQLISSLMAIVIINLFLWGPLLVARAHWAPKEGLLKSLFNQAYILDHLQSGFGLGLVDSSRVWFYVSVTALFLFLTIRSVETRRWA